MAWTQQKPYAIRRTAFTLSRELLGSDNGFLHRRHADQLTHNLSTSGSSKLALIWYYGSVANSAHISKDTTFNEPWAFESSEQL